ncbi:MAG: hybrid sensor histidine kinase/response regulator, partial [Polaribacter sp.]
KIWASTKDGIYRYNTKTNKVEGFHNFKGQYHINSTFKDAENGFLYFGGTEGFIEFNPKKVVKETYVPKIIFTDFKLFNKSVHIGEGSILENQICSEKQIQLAYNQNVFTFNFASLEYPFSKGTQFQVRMDGFEAAWRNIGLEQSATYTNLSPGSYVFNVRSKTIDENWSSSISVNLLITPPYWKTWWAYFMYAILVVVCLFFIRKYTIKWAYIQNRLAFEKQKREEQDKLHQIKQRFFANISHEIRTPLTLIMSSLNVLQKEDKQGVEKKSISTIKNNTKRLLNLVNELLNFRKLETGNLKLSVEKTNMVTFAYELFLAFSQEAIINKISYQFISENKNIEVWIDKMQLEKALFNLLSNAFKFTEKKNTISLEIVQKETVTEIIVKDTGKGISEEKLPHIFDRFYHTNYQNLDGKGFGIGLSIVKDIVELHFGLIKVESTINQGSTFIINIPLGNKHFKEDEIKKPVLEQDELINYKKEIDNVYSEEFKDKTLLLIEDNTYLREYLKDFLSKNYKIIEASNGEIGLQKTLDHNPDLVISDVMMPKMDGFSFCYQLKTDVRISHIPVILLTARSFAIDKIEGLKHGADDFLIKPFNEEVLKARINNLLRNRKLLHKLFSRNSILAPKDIILSSPDETLLNKLVELLETNIENSDFSVDELSKEIGMSHSGLYKKIKVLTGMTIVGFIRDFR